MKFRINIQILLFFIGYSATSQNSFGEILYPHSGSILSSGFATKTFPGFLMAGFVPSSTQGSPNFYIDRTDAGGIINGNPNVFQRAYNISSSMGGGCSVPSPISDCNGISVIESVEPGGPFLGGWVPSGNYALAGTCSEGCFFSRLSLNGTPVTSKLYPITRLSPATTFPKPLIIEASTSLTGLKEYFICGSFRDPSTIVTGMIYALRVNSLGAVIWSAYYFSVTGEPKAIIENPYTADLMIVGNYSGSVGFVTWINPLTGNYNPLVSTNVGVNYYNINSNPGWFSSISVANSPLPNGPGFIIGGSSQPINNSGNSWFLKMGPGTNGPVYWSKLITANSDNVAGDIQTVQERKNSSGNYEYYGATNSQAGIIVHKLNASGIPSGSNDEFVYDVGGGKSVVNSISYLDGTGTDDGIQIFGTDDGSSPSAHYLTKAYFSGHSGCSSPVSSVAFESTGINITNTAWTVSAGPRACSQFNLSSIQTNAFNAICGPFSSIPAPASNSKAIISGFEKNSENHCLIDVYPNPTFEHISIKWSKKVLESIKIELFNSLDELITCFQTSGNENVEQVMEIDLVKLNIKHGIYFIKVIIDKKKYVKKIVYTK